MADKRDKAKDGLLEVMQRLEAAFGGKPYTKGEKVVWFLELEGGTAGRWTQEIIELAASIILEGEATMSDNKFKPCFYQFKFYIGNARRQIAARAIKKESAPEGVERTESNDAILERGLRVMKDPYVRVKLLATRCYTTDRMDKDRWSALCVEAEEKSKTGEDMDDTIKELEELLVAKFVMRTDADGKEFKKYVGGGLGKPQTKEKGHA